MRLINADALIPIMKYATTDNEIGVFPIRIGFDAIKGVIDEAPTIDAVEVVRCKDCLNRDNSCGMGEHKWCRFLKQTTSPDDYCSYGERREDGEA
jgi:hypothetical protein